MQPEASLFFPSTLSLIELTDEVLRDPVRRENTDHHHHETQPQGTELEQGVCTWERERCKLKVIILVQSPESASTSSVCVAKISLCVCVFMAFCLHDSRVSVNQSTLKLYTSGPDGSPRLFVDTVYSCFPSADSSHPLSRQLSHACRSHEPISKGAK